MSSLPSRSRLRFLDASDLDDADVDFDGLDVINAQQEKLGEVDGFIVDADSGRPFYLVVDAGGWFKTKEFLLPVGHARLDAEGEHVIADLSKATVDRYPGFDRDRFEKLSDEELDAFNRDTVVACCSDAATATPVSSAASGIGSSTAERSGPRVSQFDQWNHYGQPSWWHGVDAPPRSSNGTDHATLVAGPHPELPPTEQVMARDRSEVRGTYEVKESSVAEASPHYDGRAQPGDVIGVETGAEETHIGDTGKDENERRENAEKQAAKARRNG